jgi:hypothetical protein
MFKINVFYHRRQIDLTLSVPNTPNWNLNMDDSGFHIYKGLRNTLEVIVRNNDRKPINLLGSQVIFTISDPETRMVLYQKPLPIINPLTGNATLILDYFDTMIWPLGFLRYNVMLQGSDGSQNVLFVDQNEGFSGYFELSEGPDYGPIDSLVCTVFTPGALYSYYQNYFYSTTFPGNAQNGLITEGEITMAAYTTNWTGLISLQGSIEIEVPTDYDQWFPVSLNGQQIAPLVSYTGITPIAFEASLTWVRLVYLPDITNVGTFDQVLYRA